ncbi:MAG: hypothetical protein AAB448_04600 [Patescibacteria group bacterium]
MEYVSRYQSTGSLLVSALVLGSAVLFGSLFLVPNAAHAAAPTMTASTITADTNSDGTVDRITVFFSEASDLDDTSGAADGFTSLAFNNGCTIVNGDYTGAGVLSMAFTVSGCTSGNTAITPTAAYTAVASCATNFSICDDAEANQMANAENRVAADGAKPAITIAATSDNDSNGTVDRLALTFSESVVITDGGTDDDITLVASSGTATITAGTYGATASTLTYTITTSVSGDTALTVTPTYATGGAGDITDAAANEMANAETVSGTDGAKPAILSAVTGDNNVDAAIDRLVLTFSESVTITDGGTDDDITLVASTGTATITAGTYGATASTLTYTITTSTSNNTSLTVTPTYATGGTGSIADAAANEMLDTETVAGTDGAGPVLISASPTSLQSGVNDTATITLTYSEAPTTWGGSMTGSVSLVAGIADAVVTLTHSARFIAGANTLTISSSPDAAANAFAGAQAGDSTVASPLIFYVASSDNNEDVEITYSVNLLTPEADDSFEAGTTTDITWANDGGNASYANLYYSEDAGVTWETIVTNTLNDSSYTWTVPYVNSDVVLVKIVTTDLATELATDTSSEFSVWYTVGTEPVVDEEVVEEVEIVDVGTIVAGNYIKSESGSTIYYIDSSLMRRPFFDAQTYFTYQDDFDTVITVADDALAEFVMGAPMLPKAGVVLVKIQSVAKVYMVEEDAYGDMWLRWITSEDVAEEMFGAYWSSYVVDVDVTLFTRYEEGEDVDVAEDVDTDMMKYRVDLHD